MPALECCLLMLLSSLSLKSRLQNARGTCSCFNELTTKVNFQMLNSTKGSSRLSGSGITEGSVASKFSMTDSWHFQDLKQHAPPATHCSVKSSAGAPSGCAPPEGPQSRDGRTQHLQKLACHISPQAGWLAGRATPSPGIGLSRLHLGGRPAQKPSFWPRPPDRSQPIAAHPDSSPAGTKMSPGLWDVQAPSSLHTETFPSLLHLCQPPAVLCHSLSH